MSSLRPDHLTPADVEAWLEGKLSLSASTHVGRCDDCRSLLLAERHVVETLHQLPRFSPSIGFCDRVMAQVTLPTLAEVAASKPFRIGVWLTGAGLVTTLAVSLVWSFANRAVLTDASQWALGEGWSTARAAADQFSAMLSSMPAVRDVQRAIGTPTRLAAVSGSLLVLYSTGLVALRRLLALPTAEVAHAGR
jgi:hypothetical protein